MKKSEAQNVLNYLQLRVLSCHKEAEMIKEGKIPAPRMAIVYPTYACNHRCLGCDYKELNKTGRSFTETEFMDVIDQLIDIGVKGVEFCGGGEPTLHPSLPKIVDRLAESKIAFGFLTNGTNLNAALAERLVKNGSYCRISVESASEKIFNRYKRPVNKSAGLKNVIYNIRRLVSMRNRALPDTKLQVSMKYAVDLNNFDDVSKAVTLAAKLRVDSVQFKLIRNVSSEIRDRNIIRTLESKLARLEHKYPHLRIVGDFKKSKLKTKCWLSPIQLVVDPNGDVYICCYYRHRMKEHCLGNMLKHRLKNIWYNKEHWKKISNINKADCNKYDCRFHYYNELMKNLVIDDIGQLSFI